MDLNKRLEDSSSWILDSKKSLVILMLMATSIGSLFFLVLALAMLFGKVWFFALLFAFFCYGSLNKFLGIVKMVKSVGIQDALGGITAREFVWHQGGKEDGRNRTEQDIKASSKCNAEGNKKGRGQVRGCEEDTEPANPWDSLSIRIDEDNRKEAGNK